MRWAAVALVLATLTPCVLAQSTSSVLLGRVGTATGQPVAAAIVQARSVGTGIVRTAVTDEEGRYRVDSLPPGSWTVVARLADGMVSESRTVELRLQESVRLDFYVGAGLTERVTVVAEPPLIDRHETAGKLRVSRNQVDRLPLSGRVFTDLALLDSSVRSAAPGNYFGERGSVFVVNGQSGRSNSFLVDGLDNNDQISGTTLNSFFSQQVIGEFVLLTHQYSPEFGRASGGVLNIVTRRGGNDRTVEAFAQGSSDRWNSTGDFVDRLPQNGTEQDALRRYQAGFSLGGPFRRDKAFYFFAYEHQQANDVIPITGIDRNGIRGGRFAAPSNDDNLFLRTDFNLGTANTLMLRLSLDDRHTSGVNVGGLFTAEAGFTIDERDVNLAATLTTVVTPNAVNELRVLAATSTFDQQANSDRPGVSRPTGIFGGNYLNLQQRDEARLQLVENVTWRIGEHTLKFGIDVSRSRTKLFTRFNPNGNFSYDTDLPFEPGDCGDIFLNQVQSARANGTYPFVPCPGEPGVDDDGDGIIDEDANIETYPVVMQYIFGEPRASLDDTKVGLFVQDRWQVGPRLLIDYGLRYDLSTYRLPASARVDSTVANGGARRDTDDVAPRLGFTYTPRRGGNLIIRGGGGLFYDKLVLGFPAVAAITSGTQIGLFFPQGTTVEVTEDFIEDQGIDSVLPSLFFPDQLVLRFSTGTELETPYTTQFNLGVERSFGPRHALRANVVRAQGYNLPLLKDLNPVVGVIGIPGSCPETVQPVGAITGIPCHGPDPARGSIAAFVTEGRSWYTGVDLNWRWQGEESWLNSSYTWSRAEDLGFDPLKGGISLPPDSTNLAGERGRSDGDRRHRFVLSGDSALPWIGLRASAVLQLSSGMPFNVTTGSDDNLDGILTDRPVGVGRNTGARTSLAAINSERIAANASLPADAQLPMIGSIDEPSFAQVDLRLYRRFVLGERRGSGELFLQMINVFDRENAGLIEGRAISRNFGEMITLAGPPRIVELGFKIAR